MSLGSIRETRISLYISFCLVICKDAYRLDTDFVWLVISKHILDNGL